MTETQNDLTNERWLPVVGYEGWYSISDKGRVRRQRPGQGAVSHKILSPHIANGYYRVCLYRGGHGVRRYIHRLVAESFLIPDKSRTVVNHIDADKLNNNPNNLEWVTCLENSQHACSLGIQARGETNARTILSEDDVTSIIILLDSEVETQKQIGKRFNVKQQTISDIKLGRSWAWFKEA